MSETNRDDDTAAAGRTLPGEHSAARAWGLASGLPVRATGAVPRAILAAWRAAGRPVVPEARCIETGCDRLADGPRRRYPSLRLCSPCWSRLRFGWRGDGLPSVATTRGRPWLYLCADCNRSDDPAGRDWSGRWAVAWCPPAPSPGRGTAAPEPGNYRPLCLGCLDTSRRGSLPAAH